MYKSLILSLTIILSACRTDGWKEMQTADGVYNEIKAEYAPDKREALLDIRMIYANGSLQLKGESNLPEAVEHLVRDLNTAGLKVQNDIQILPTKDLEGLVFGIINNSVANIRTKPKHSAELATQALLGTVVDVLKHDGEWYLIQTPDKYLAWIDHGGLVLIEDKRKWAEEEKIIYTSSSGFVYKDSSTEGAVISDIVMGCQLVIVAEMEDYYQVRYPDGRLGFVRIEETDRYSVWFGKLDASGELIESIAKMMTGSPYLWGGTSAKGVDCSGFIKMAYLMNGLVIPRDASLQINAGKVVDSLLQFEGLEKGDLVFFGKAATDSTKQRTTHVGIWLGDSEFIHASKYVRVSSINPAKNNFDEFNKNRYLGARRYLGNTQGGITDLKKSRL